MWQPDDHSPKTNYKNLKGFKKIMPNLKSLRNESFEAIPQSKYEFDFDKNQAEAQRGRAIVSKSLSKPPFMQNSIIDPKTFNRYARAS